MNEWQYIPFLKYELNTVQSYLMYLTKLIGTIVSSILAFFGGMVFVMQGCSMAIKHLWSSIFFLCGAAWFLSSSMPLLCAFTRACVGHVLYSKLWLSGVLFKQCRISFSPPTVPCPGSGPTLVISFYFH